MKISHGGDIYDKNIRLDLSVSLNPLGCPESVGKAVSGSIGLLHLYPDIRYSALKEAIAGYENRMYAGNESPVRKEMIVPGSGASELISAAAHEFSGKNVLIKLPVFSGYERAFENAGCKVSFVQPGVGSDHLPDDGSGLISRITSGGFDLVVIGSPANPTGQVINEDLMKDIVKACSKVRSVLLCDEAFMGFVKEKKKYTLAGHLPGNGHMIIIRSFTKLYSCPGLRLGYAVCSEPDLADRITAHLPEWNISMPAEKAMTALCAETDFADKSTEYVSKEREYMMSEMSKLGLNVMHSDANFIFFRSDEKLYDRLLEKGILIRDCRDYKGLGGEGAFRIGIRDRLENDELLSALKEILCQKI